ncbi:MAG: BamA/TamA family outer membrane protein [Pseudomonadales bacterium]|nr:BamA/TamA family outer membrane protein [Pseudomonadales bacterium]
MPVMSYLKSHSFYLCAAFGIFSLGISEISTAAENCTGQFIPATGSYEFVREGLNLENFTGTQIGQVHFTRLPIFDEQNPDEDNSLFQWANRFHVLTQERTVEQQLLFVVGDSYDSRILQESARLLRSQGFFYDAAIRPVSQCNGEIDVEVITKDNWSFTPSASFDRSGGENTYSFGLREANLFGLGKELGISDSKDSDRESTELTYKDNNVMGTRIRNRTTLIDSDDGSTQSFNIDLPFFSLDSRRAWALQLENQERRDEQFFRGDDVSEVEHEIQDYSFEYGFSQGLINNSARRWSVGYRYRKDEFARSDELPPPATFPLDKEVSYPYLKFESVENNYATAFNLDQIYRTEDLHLGMNVMNRIGYAAERFGSDQNRLVIDGHFSDTLLYDDHMLWQHSLTWEGMWNTDSDKAEDLVITYGTRYFLRQSDRTSFFASIEAVYSKNLNSHRQVVLGGETGARAFDNRFQVGDRSILLTLEERLYTDIHLWNLIRVGGAVFVDVGRAWESGIDSGMEDDLLADIGFGLRLASSKAATGRIAHIDFAFPISNRNDPDVDSVQVAFTIKGSF